MYFLRRRVLPLFPRVYGNHVLLHKFAQVYMWGI